MTAVAAGRAIIEIHYNFADGPVIGRLYVQTYARIQIPMQVHLLTVNGRAQPHTFFNKAAVIGPTGSEIHDFVNRANESWVPHGIVFTIAGFVDTVWGAAEIPSGAQSPTLGEVLTAGMNSPNRSAVAVNVFVVPSVAAPVTGVGISTASARAFGLVAPAAPPPPPAVQHFGSGLFLHSSSSATPQTIQHEMGHS